jgi:cation transport ATPase
MSILFVWLASVGIVAPLLAALLHNVGALLVITNSARLLVGTEKHDTAGMPPAGVGAPGEVP